MPSPDPYIVCHIMSKTKASESKSKPQKEDSEPVLTVFEDHEVPYAVLNNALTRLVTILEKPLVGKESFTAVKLKKDHVEFLVIMHPLILSYYIYINYFNIFTV